MSAFARKLRGLPLTFSILLLGACGWVPTAPEPQPEEPFIPDPGAPQQEPISTRQFEAVTQDQEVLGEIQLLFTRPDNTLVDIARRFNLGYEELRWANPEVDVWLPGDATPVFLPTMSVIPDAPRDGLVLNLPNMRLWYFVPEEADSAAGGATWSVSSHPMGIGREGWPTPVGPATISSKARDPTWFPPLSVRAEHAEMGDPLPAIVPPGPDNPLGAFALGLSMPGYLIHGTNKPPGVGMRVSHGCIRLFPEDIAALYPNVEIGTPVHIVDQPVLAGWREGQLYLEVHPPLSEDQRDLNLEVERVIAAALQRAGRPDAPISKEAVSRIVAERSGMPFPVLAADASPNRYLGQVRVVANDVPVDVPDDATGR
jgi:L,D-transpeptidase ErfK/SrfK